MGALATSFILMRRSLSKNIQDLVRITASRQAIESELNIAREIQLGMVPKTFPSFPEHDEFDLYATLKPAGKSVVISTIFSSSIKTISALL